MMDEIDDDMLYDGYKDVKYDDSKFEAAYDYFEKLLGKKECDWKDDGTNFKTSCGHDVSSEINYMSQDDIRFCCFCGKKINLCGENDG